jgi:HK97 family phage portal protein
MALKLFNRARDKPQKNAPGAGFWFPFGPTASGKAVNERTAMTVTAVYACVRVLSEAIAGLPLHVFQHIGGGGKAHIPRHSLYFLLHDAPNPDMTSFVFRETLMAHLLLWGNAYAQIIRNGKGQVLALYPLLPNHMAVSRSAGGDLVYKYLCENGGEATLTRDQVLHIPGLGFDGLVGYSPIALARNAVGLALSAEEFGSTFFSNGANPGGILEHPGVVKNHDLLRESWRAQFGGANSHSIGVLEEGMKFHTISIPPEQAQFLETRKFQIEEIARIFRVPLHMLGDLDHATFSNVEHLSLDFVKFSLEPWVARWEQSLMQALLLPQERAELFIKFNLDGLMRGDYESRMRGYATGIQNGFLSPDDVRGLEDLNPMGGWMSKYFFNGNMVPVGGTPESRKEEQI